MNAVIDQQPLVLRPPAESWLDDEQFYRLCLENRDLRLERGSDGSLIVMSPTGFDASALNAEIVAQLQVWSRTDGSGVVTDSSGGFRLPNGAIYAPDAAWVRRDRLEQLLPAQRSRFPHLAPDFVIELRSPSDDLSALQAKMREYRANGVLLGWLLDPRSRTVRVYEQGTEEPRVYRGPRRLSADPVLPGFGLDCSAIW